MYLKETTKLGLSGDNDEIARNHCAVLNVCLRIGLDRMSPFTPFLSNELLQHTKAVFGSFEVCSKTRNFFFNLCLTVNS